MQSQIRKIIASDQETPDPNLILNLFKKGDAKPLDKVQLPKFNITEINECNNELSVKELYVPLTSIQNNK